MRKMTKRFKFLSDARAFQRKKRKEGHKTKLVHKLGPHPCRVVHYWKAPEKVFEVMDVIRFADIDWRALSPSLLQIIKNCGPTYRDEKLSEHLYSVNDLLEDEEVTLDAAEQKEAEALHFALNAAGCAYMRIAEQ